MSQYFCTGEICLTRAGKGITYTKGILKENPSGDSKSVIRHCPDCGTILRLGTGRRNSIQRFSRVERPSVMR